MYLRSNSVTSDALIILMCADLTLQSDCAGKQQADDLTGLQVSLQVAIIVFFWPPGGRVQCILILLFVGYHTKKMQSFSCIILRIQHIQQVKLDLKTCVSATNY